MVDFSNVNDPGNLESLIEAILFISPSPVSSTQLANVLDQKQKIIEEALKRLDQRFIKTGALRLQETKGRYQITTSPEISGIIEKFLGIEEITTLSRAAVEALSIVAYRQPITRPEIDDIRGVNSDGVVRNLLNKGLIQEVGRAEGVGRPILYGTTPDFLQFFGLSSISEIPPFELSSTQNDENGKILKD
jgi:segregation and condensation protein B